jgi:hypothetical protein
MFIIERDGKYFVGFKFHAAMTLLPGHQPDDAIWSDDLSKAKAVKEATALYIIEIYGGQIMKFH